MSDCLFCKIVDGTIPAAVVHRDADVVAFRDIHPQAPTHILVVPTRHVASLADASAADASFLGRVLLRVREIASREGLDRAGYRVVTNHGEDGGQSVPHLHFHLLGGRPLGWPPG